MSQQQSTSPVKISVAMCTFNGERFVGQQLETIGRQIRCVDEIVICDDGSTDRTIEIIKAFSAGSSIRLRLELNSERLGVTKNFEKAISLCDGEIIFLCDQDDLWRNDKVARLMECFADEPVGLAFSNAQVVFEDLSPAGYRLWDSIWFNEAERRDVNAGDALPVLLKHAVAAGTTLALRSKYRSLLFPIPDLKHVHDIWITLLLACVSRVVAVDEELIQYRLHSANEVGMRRYGLLGQIKMARQQIDTDAFGYAVELHQAARERLASEPMARQTLESLDEKIRHSRLRKEMPGNWFFRLPVIAGELRRGNYGKYSYGFKSVLQDLFLR